jgi:hypothetical protein
MATDLNKEKLALIEWIVRQEKPAALKPLLDALAQVDKETEDINRIVGYRSRGVRVTRKQLVDSLIEGIRNLDSEKLISLDQIEQESDQW